MNNFSLLARLTASFLASSFPLQVMGWLLFFSQLMTGVYLLHGGNLVETAVLILALLLSLPLAWFSLRIKFDEFAFTLIAEQQDAATALHDFDGALIKLQLRKEFDSRNIGERASAAKNLVARLAIVVGFQLVLTLLGIFLHYVD